MGPLQLSVALCTYNGARFLQEQLDSIASQSLLPDELVLCDDRSNDDTFKIVQRFAHRVRFPVRTVVNRSTLGSSKNFEQAVRLCRDRSLCFPTRTTSGIQKGWPASQKRFSPARTRQPSSVMPNSSTSIPNL